MKIGRQYLYIICLSFILFMSCYNKAKRLDKNLLFKNPGSKNLIIKDTNLDKLDYLSYDTHLNTIYLTFDDGTLEGTYNCFTICQNLKVPASFFMVGWHISRSEYGKKLFKKIIVSYPDFDICNHSFYHAFNHYAKYYKKPKLVYNDIKLNKDSLKLRNNIVRLPGRNLWLTRMIYDTVDSDQKVIKEFINTNQSIIGWDIEWEKDKRCLPIQNEVTVLKNIDLAFTNYKTKTAKHLVLLMHDNMFRLSKDSIKLVNFINSIKANKNYRIAPIHTYPNL